MVGLGVVGQQSCWFQGEPPMSNKTRAERSSTATRAAKNEIRGPATQVSAGTQLSEPKSVSKSERVFTLLRADDATIDELVSATGWLKHTTRAALTGLKNKGHVITAEKVDGVRQYRIGTPSQ
jgi:homoserine dehydrogenase